MKVLTVGCGNIGSVAARDLAISRNNVEVALADYDKTRAEARASLAFYLG